MTIPRIPMVTVPRLHSRPRQQYNNGYGNNYNGGNGNYNNDGGNGNYNNGGNYNNNNYNQRQAPQVPDTALSNRPGTQNSPSAYYGDGNTASNDKVWVKAHWKHTNDGWVWIDGYWKPRTTNY